MQRTNAFLIFGVWLAVAFGIGVRVVAYVQNPSLWIDEAMLALNVVHRTPSELFQPLDLNQGAPVGYLQAAKLCVRWFGSSELSLRAVSFVSGLLAFAAFVPLVYNTLPRNSARLATVLFALSPYLAAYGAEFKQYESDAAIAIGLLLLGSLVWRENSGHAERAALAIAGAVAVWFSHPAAFVLAGVGTAILADAAVRREREKRIITLLAVTCWTISFGICYFVFLRKLGTNPYLTAFWSGKFLPFPPTGPGDIAWVVMHYFELFERPGGLNAGTWGLAGLAGLCYLVGVYTLAHSNWRLLVALLVPMFFCLVASGLHKYPFAGRLMLFGVPGILILVAVGLTTFIERLSMFPVVNATLIGLFVGAGAIECVRIVTAKPLHGEATREALREVWEGWRDGDRLFVSNGAMPTFAYYHDRFPFPPDSVSFGVDQRDGSHAVLRHQLEPLRGQSRVWVVVSHFQNHHETQIRDILDELGNCTRLSRRPDAVVMRYDLTDAK